MTQRTLQTIEWNAYPLQIPPAKERLLLIVSAAGQPPSLKLIGKSEVAIGYWTGDAFRVMSGFLRPRLVSIDWQPAVTHWARLAPCLPQGIDLVHDRRFEPDVAIERGTEAPRRPPSLLPSTAMSRCAANSKSSLSGRRKMRGVHLSIKQVHLLRVLFSIGLTAFVGVGTFLVIRHLIGLSAK